MSRVSILPILFMVLASATATAQVIPPVPGACEAPAYMRALGEGRWLDALAQAERCYDDADRKLADDLWNLNHGVYYRLAAAQLLAMLGRTASAETLLSTATNEAVPSFLAPTDALIAETDAFIRERSGSVVGARDRYVRIKKAGRSALLALGAGDDIDARLWGRIGEIYNDPTALYVLGALAELHGDWAMARYYYVQAQSGLASLAARNLLLPIAFFERDRIEAALARVPGLDMARVVTEDRIRTYVDRDGRRIAQERWPGVLAMEAVRERQHQYNEWATIKRQFASGLIEFSPQYPRRFATDSALAGIGIETLRVPGHIEVTGVLDLDTVAVGYYHAAVEWAELCAAAHLTRTALEKPVVALDARVPESEDRSEAVRWLLAQAYDDLRRLRAFLSGAVMQTAAGETFDAVGETSRYAANLAKLRARLPGAAVALNPYDSLPLVVLIDPPDFVTAHIPAERFSDAFVQHLLLRERTMRGRLFLARSLLESEAEGTSDRDANPAQHSGVADTERASRR